jgi:DNA-binding transcriptional ArsR family regulator
MNVQNDGSTVPSIAAAIGEPARARMLYCLLDGRARTATELAIVARVSPSTASVHLGRLKAERLLKVAAQGKHRYYALQSRDVAAALEALGVLAGEPQHGIATRTPNRLRAARTCYDHLAGALGVSLHDCLVKQQWLWRSPDADVYDLTRRGVAAVEGLGIDVGATRALRRRFAFPCVDWSERRPHLGGGLAAELLRVAFARKWIRRDLDSRAVTVTAAGRRELQRTFDLEVEREQKS